MTISLSVDQKGMLATRMLSPAQMSIGPDGMKNVPVLNDPSVIAGVGPNNMPLVVVVKRPPGAKKNPRLRAKWQSLPAMPARAMRAMPVRKSDKASVCFPKEWTRRIGQEGSRAHEWSVNRCTKSSFERVKSVPTRFGVAGRPAGRHTGEHFEGTVEQPVGLVGFRFGEKGKREPFQSY